VKPRRLGRHLFLFFFLKKERKIGIDFMKNDERKKELLFQKGSGIQ
jgi:CRISPR/Cas system CMR-associated protein Cmr3 (group 5 of RAMP superfamily)